MFDFKSLAPQQQLFYYMHHALKKSKTIKDYAIFLIGEIRSGKSTTFNWITNPQSIIGRGNEIEAKYFIKDNESTSALVKDSYESVTLIQNMQTLSESNNQVDLIDLPGFHDSRTPSQILLVNYIINTCFSYCNNVKFIIVISKNEFMNINGLSFINSIKEFIKLFESFPQEQRKKVYKSVGMLITSVDLTQYDSYKEYYLNKLKENLEKIKSMASNNEEIKLHYPFIEEVLHSIINDKRLQLFKMAKDKQSPTPSPIIDQFNHCGWSYYNLKEYRSNLCYPYKQYYSKLKYEEQKKINKIIFDKIRQFQDLQFHMAAIIDAYLQNPYNRELDLSEHYQNLKNIIAKNRVHEDIPTLTAQENDNDNSSQIMPISIYSKLCALINITFDIKDDYERTFEQKEKQSYFQYLGHFFKISIELFSQAFALISQSKQIMTIIFSIFNEYLEELRYITEINNGLVSSCSFHLKEALQVMNRTHLLRDDIPKPFIAELQRENFQVGQHQYSEEELNQTCSFIVGLDWSHYDLTSKFIILSKIYKAKGKKMNENKDYQISVENVVLAFQNVLKNRYLIQKKKVKGKVHKKIQDQDKFPLNFIEQLLKDLYISMFFIQKQWIVSFLQCYDLDFIIQESLEDLQSHIENSNVHLLWEFYASYYEKNNKYRLAKEIYKKLETNTEIKKQKRIKQIQIKIKLCDNKGIGSSQQYLQLEKPKLQIKNEIIIQLMNQLSHHILKNQIYYDRYQLQQEILNYLNKKKLEIKQNQFEYTVSKEPKFAQIITISEKLISKINQRKVILMIGNRSGKTTSFYWMLKKQLTNKKVGNNKYIYDLINQNNDQNRINHRGYNPTFIPNIEQFAEGELLIDFSSIVEKRIINTMIQKYLLQLIISNSKEIKFLLVVKEENIFMNDCKELLQTLQYCLKLLPSIQGLNKHFALLINHSTNSIKKHSQNFNDFLQEFSKPQSEQFFQEKYNIKLSDQKLYKQIIEGVINKNNVILFPKAARQFIKQQETFSNFRKGRPWTYIKSLELKKQVIYESLQKLAKKEEQIARVRIFLKQQFSILKQLVRNLGNICQSSAFGKQIKVSLEIDENFVNQWDHSQTFLYENTPQLFLFNQIFAIKQLRRFIDNLQYHCDNIPQINQKIVNLINLVKYMSYKNENDPIALSWIEKRIEGIMKTAKIIQDANNKISVGFGCQLSDYRYVLKTIMDWIDNFYSNNFKNMFEKLIESLDFDLLVKEMNDANMNSLERLLKFIVTDLSNGASYKLKQNQAVIKLNELSRMKGNYSYCLYAQLFLFQQSFSGYSIQCKQDKKRQLDIKIKLIEILKESIVMCAHLSQNDSFSLCGQLKCHDTQCNVYEELIDIQKDKNGSILRTYMQFCLQLGYKDKFIQQCKKHSEIEQDESLKNHYNEINYKILSNERTIINRKNTAYDNIENLKIEDLHSIYNKIKQICQDLHQIRNN